MPRVQAACDAPTPVEAELSRRSWASTAVLLLASAALAACGIGGDEASGPRTVNWYAFNEPGGAYEQSIADCNKQANGRYRINYVRLPTDANQQRELVVRRLAAEDDTVDIVNMDVPWTAEFAEAGWILPWTGERKRVAEQGRLDGPLESVRYQDEIWAIPYTSNTQLLWYRKDRVPKPAANFTWDEMIDQAVRNGTQVEVQARQYEGFTVWINALIEGAGGQLVDAQGEDVVDDTAKTAAEIVSKLANSSAAPPGMSTNAEDDARLGFESGRSDYQINYSFIYPSAAEVSEGFQRNIGWARYPRSVADRESRPPLGGFNLGIGAFSKKKDLAFEAAECLASEDSQLVAAEKGGLAPSSAAVYDRPALKKAFPFADLLRQSIDQAGPRPVTPAYTDISQAIQKTFHPPADVDPDTIVDQLRERIDKAAEGGIF
jgi:multiple sugar transport system substrate-binding protein